MTETDKRKSAKTFAEYWKNRGYEKGDSQPFWLSLLRDVLGVEHPEQYITFENQVHIDHTSFIDAYIEQTHVLIEQKSKGSNLLKPIKQSDGSLLSPFQQAKRYSDQLPYSKRARWIITCNFGEFHIYDMEKMTGEPESILLSDLAEEYYRLEFLINESDDIYRHEEKISLEAGKLVGQLYEAIRKQYIDPDSDHAQKSMNMLCVRLVFCLYAEDAGIFKNKMQFHDYIKSFAVKDVRRAVIDLFRVLNQDDRPDAHVRDPYMTRI